MSFSYKLAHGDREAGQRQAIYGRPFFKKSRRSLDALKAPGFRYTKGFDALQSLKLKAWKFGIQKFES